MRRTAVTVAKVVFAIVVLTFLFRKVNLPVVWATLVQANRWLIILGIGLNLLTVLIAGWRWHRLLGIFKIHIPLLSLTCIAQIGQFFVVFLPGPVGDDLTRMLYVSRLAPDRVGEACSTVLLDRCVGLASVLLLAVCCIPGKWDILASSGQTHWLALIILSGGIAICVFGAAFFLMGHPTHRWFERRLLMLPQHSLRDEAARIWGLLCVNKRPLAQVIGAALVTQLLLCAVFYLAGLSVGINAPFLSWLSFVPIVLAANVLPITVAGLGVREFLLVLFLGVLARVDSERALAASLITFSMILAVCLLGGLLYIFYRLKDKSGNSPDVREATL